MVNGNCPEVGFCKVYTVSDYFTNAEWSMFGKVGWLVMNGVIFVYFAIYVVYMGTVLG